MALFSVNQNAYWITADSVPTITKHSNNEVTISLGEKHVTLNANNGGYIKYVTAADMARKLKTWTIPIPTKDADGNSLSTSNFVTIAITAHNYHALGDNQTGDFTFTRKYNTETGTSNYLSKLAEDINYSAIKELVTAEYNNGAFVLTENEQDWIQGLMADESVDFLSINVLVDGEIVSTDVTKGESNTPIPNSRMIADMEWFYLGEHGDQQRLMGYPYANAATIKGTIYKIKADDEDGYDLITIHHAYVGNGTFVQKSEQDVLIACIPAKGDPEDEETFVPGTTTGTLSAINTAFGTTVSTNNKFVTF